MTDWTSGYVADIDYTYGYYREMSPAHLELVMLNRATAGNGADVPRYLELGFGQGVSLAVHAAACEGEFWGTDFMPGHAAHAKSLVEAAGSDARIFDQSFAEFAARDDLPEFDVIALHGIWSWIAPEHRQTIIDLIRRRLAVGGILYIGYNAMPGCAPLKPIRDLMSLHARLAGSAGAATPQRVADAVAFTRSVIDSGANYFFSYPVAAARFENIASFDSSYLAHEYLTEHWHPMSFAEIHALLEEAKVEFVATARMLEHIDGLHVMPEGQAILDGIGNPVLRETVRDVMINNRFRADVFVRGGRRLSGIQRHAGYLATSFILTVPPDEVPMTLKTVAGELVFDEAIYRPLLAAMADDGHAPKLLATLRVWPGLDDIALESIIQALLVLIAEGHVYPAQTEPAAEKARPRCNALNDALIKEACFNGRVEHLASPVTGAGHRVPRIERLFILARNGRMPVEQWPQFVQATAKATGATLRNDDQPVVDADEQLAELTRQAASFQVRRLPILQALGIA